MEVKRLRIQITEIFKILNDSNPVLRRIFFIIDKTKAIRSITFMYIAVTRQDKETTAVVS